MVIECVKALMLVMDESASDKPEFKQEINHNIIIYRIESKLFKIICVM